MPPASSLLICSTTKFGFRKVQSFSKDRWRVVFSFFWDCFWPQCSIAFRQTITFFLFMIPFFFPFLFVLSDSYLSQIQCSQNMSGWFSIFQGKAPCSYLAVFLSLLWGHSDDVRLLPGRHRNSRCMFDIFFCCVKLSGGLRSVLFFFSSLSFRSGCHLSCWFFLNCGFTSFFYQFLYILV